MLLVPTTTYRADDFVAAAEKVGVELVLGTDRCHVLEELGAVTHSRDNVQLEFLDPEESAARIARYAERKPLDGILAADDATTVIAALASEALGLPHNPVDAAGSTRDKLEMRRRFETAGVRQARFREIPVSADPATVPVDFPCVLKPRMLSASRGVIRADDRDSFVAAFRRVTRLLADPEVKGRGGERAKSLLVESYVPGVEVALEGVLTGGRLDPLALFDKPDPLEGPYFEETLYVTPSRLSAAVQRDIVEETQKAARALGLREGPVHAELRVNDHGAWVLEVAARSIGGLCSRTLRFGAGMSLEEVLLRHALWRAGKAAAPHERRETRAAGVMMLPIPKSGVFRGVGGVEEARAVPNVEEITITAVEGRDLIALPEGSSYLGFAFARADTPEEVERALREAHAKLDIRIAASLVKVEEP